MTNLIVRQEENQGNGQNQKKHQADQYCELDQADFLKPSFDQQQPKDHVEKKA